MTSISASLAMHLSLIVVRYQFAFLSIHPIHSIVVEIFLKFWKCTHLQEQTPSSPLIPMASKRRVVSSWNGIIQGIYIYIFRNARASLVGEELFFSFRYCENIFKIIDDNFYVSLHILFLDIFLLLLRIRMLRGMMLLKFRSTKFRSFRCFIFLILNRF